MGGASFFYDYTTFGGVLVGLVGVLFTLRGMLFCWQNLMPHAGGEGLVFIDFLVVG